MKKFIFLTVILLAVGVQAAEINYNLSPSEAKRLRDYFTTGAGVRVVRRAGLTKTRTTHYIDTEDLLLKSNGYSVRIREKTDTLEFTVSEKGQPFEEALNLDDVIGLDAANLGSPFVYECEMAKKDEPQIIQEVRSNPGVVLSEDFKRRCRMTSTSDEPGFKKGIHPVLKLQELLSAGVATDASELSSKKIVRASELKVMGFSKASRYSVTADIGGKVRILAVEDVTFENGMSTTGVEVEVYLPLAIAPEQEEQARAVVERVRSDLERHFQAAGLSSPEPRPAGVGSMAMMIKKGRNDLIGELRKGGFIR